MAKADALLPVVNEHNLNWEMAETQSPPSLPKIPTAAEIIAQREALKQAEGLIEAHALEQINLLINSLKAIGIFYKLVESDGPAAPPKPRAAMKCGACGQPGHRSNKCKTTVEG